MTTPARVPLARLLAAGYRWMIEELHRQLAERGWSGLRPAYGFVLLALRDAPLTPTELAARLDVSKQAASKLADAMVQAGLVRRTTHPTDARRCELSLSALGHDLLTEVEEVYAELEAEWSAIIGRERVEATEAALTEVLLALNAGAMPPIRPTA